MFQPSLHIYYQISQINDANKKAQVHFYNELFFCIYDGFGPP